MTATTPTRTRSRMDPMRKISLTAGVLYLITFVASIPALKLYADVLDHPDYITTVGSNTPLLWGALGEVITAAASIGTAVALYPVAKRVSGTAAIGFVTSRVVEATLILTGVLSLLSVATLRNDLAGAPGTDVASLTTVGQSLVALHDWTFLLGPGLIPGVNALLLGYVMYRSRLVPRIIPVVGLIGAPILIGSAVAIMFGAFDQLSTAGALSALLIATWEFSLGVWMTVKGFRPSSYTTTAAPVSAGRLSVPVA
jgi:hypothetical protein